MTKKAFEEGKIRLVMKVRRMSRAAAVRLIRNQNAASAEPEETPQSPSGVKTGNCIKSTEFMTADDFFGEIEELDA